MNRRSLVALVVGSLAVGAAFESLAAGPGIFRPRTNSRGQTVTRTYRSYSVSPETVVEPGAAVVPGSTDVISGPASAASRPRTSTHSKPSYMRADSKASGRFGQ